jgi:hypothetical protein
MNMVMKLSGNPATKTDDSKYVKTTNGIETLTAPKGVNLVDDIMAFLTGNEDTLYSFKDIVLVLAASKPVKYSDIRNRDVKRVMPFLMALHPEVVE